MWHVKLLFVVGVLRVSLTLIDCVCLTHSRVSPSVLRAWKSKTIWFWGRGLRPLTAAAHDPADTCLQRSWLVVTVH